jgi:hypothetical protein
MTFRSLNTMEYLRDLDVDVRVVLKYIKETVLEGLIHLDLIGSSGGIV